MIEEKRLEVGPIWGNDEAEKKVTAFMVKNKMLEEGWHWTGHWNSDRGKTSYAYFWRLKNAPPTRNLHNVSNRHNDSTMRNAPPIRDLHNDSDLHNESLLHNDHIDSTWRERQMAGWIKDLDLSRFLHIVVSVKTIHQQEISSIEYLNRIQLIYRPHSHYYIS